MVFPLTISEFMRTENAVDTGTVQVSKTRVLRSADRTHLLIPAALRSKVHRVKQCTARTSSSTSTVTGNVVQYFRPQAATNVSCSTGFAPFRCRTSANPQGPWTAPVNVFSASKSTRHTHLRNKSFLKNLSSATEIIPNQAYKSSRYMKLIFERRYWRLCRSA